MWRVFTIRGGRVPFDVQDSPGEGRRNAARVGLRSLGARASPALVDCVGEQRVPAVEQLRTKCVELVQLLVRRQDVAVVAGLSQQDSAPVVDELRDVDGPVDLGDFTEDGAEEIVEGDLPVEAYDEVMDLTAGVEVSSTADSSGL